MRPFLKTACSNLTLTCCLLFTSPSFAESAEISDAARAHFAQGVEALSLEIPDYQTAHEKFTAAYDASPSWKILGNLGIAALNLERDGEAIEAFEQYLREGRPALEPGEIEHVEADLNLLRKGVAWITLEVPEGSIALVDTRIAGRGENVVNEYKLRGTRVRLGLRAGAHELTLELTNGKRLSWNGELSAGDKASHDFSAKPAPKEPKSPDAAKDREHRPVPTGVYVGLGSTILFAGGAGAFGALALGKSSSFDELNDGYNFDEAESAQKSAQTLGLVSDVLWGAAAVSAGVTAYLYFTRPTQNPEQDSTALQWAPAFNRDTLALSLSGKF